MARRTSYTAGTPNWVDLTTSDLAGAQAFYGAVFGWSTREVMPGFYSYFVDDDGAIVAGLAELNETQIARGMPPSWSMYVSVDDVAATADRARELGGTVVFGPEAIEETGALAAVADPQGAVVLLWQPAPFAGAEVVNGPGLWSWNDLQTPDPEVASPFYEALFGWTTAAIPGADGVYRTIGHEGRNIGGIMRAPAGVAHPYWTVYIGVAELDATLERIGAAGGQTLVEPMAVPAGRFAVTMDPQNAILCLVESHEYDD
ncbi:Putative glyoxylase CFP32 [Baekduia alba]|uniref:VOC family protein n=1 Tax=Baekduia alba TaxID=2997333 RepID=UPI00233FC750|nr:VOC family protein [Baekduia alba]WCB95845.1 Putative glyoxylase CFP32 [Baekduia alba]